MAEVLILPEMVEAGLEAMKKCESSGAGDTNTVILIFLAMRGIEEMVLQVNTGSVH